MFILLSLDGSARGGGGEGGGGAAAAAVAFAPEANLGKKSEQLNIIWTGTMLLNCPRYLNTPAPH